MQIVFNHNSKTFSSSKCFFNHSYITSSFLLSMVFIIIKIIFRNIWSIFAKWSDNMRYLIFAHIDGKLFCYRTEVTTIFKFSLSTLFLSQSQLTKSPVLPKLPGALPLDPTGGAYSTPPNPPAALVEHQRCSITCYASKKFKLEHCYCIDLSRQNTLALLESRFCMKI